jgi:putative endonuclease
MIYPFFDLAGPVFSLRFQTKYSRPFGSNFFAPSPIQIFPTLLVQFSRSDSNPNFPDLSAPKINQKILAMTRHIDFGRNGEDMAVEWLTAKGYTILHRNWRHGRYEVDIIATLNGVYHFIEVKSGKDSNFGYPEERVNRRKMQNMMKAAAAWLHHVPGSKQVQYNVLAITIRNDEPPEYFLFEDVYL